MHVPARPHPDIAAPAPSADEAQRGAIAQAVRGEIHWRFPRHRRVTVTVDGDDIAVALGPRRTAVPHAAHRPEVSP